MILQIIVLSIFRFKSSLAQTTSASCITGFEWTLNNLQQSPCLVAAILGHQCAPDTAFNVPEIVSGQRYLPPSGQQANSCECSSIYFSLLSACAICQGSSLGTFTSWTQACPQSNVSLETYPMTTPNGTRIPPWAYLPLSNGAFDVLAAGRNATSDESFGKSSGALSTGAIVGLAVGSSVALLLIVIAVYMYWRIKKVERHRGQPLLPDSSPDRSGVRYDKIEGPPRRPWRFWPQPTPKVVSHRAGLNFDLNKNRRGDLLELSEAHKGSKNQQGPRDSPSSAFASRTSIETTPKLGRKKEREPGDSGLHSSLPKFFSRAKEVKPRGEARLNLAENRASSPSDQSPQLYNGSSPGRDDRPAVLDM